VKKLEEHPGNKITQEMYNRLDAKVESIIKANDLKCNKWQWTPAGATPGSLPQQRLVTPVAVSPYVWVVRQMISPILCSKKIIVIAQDWPCWLGCMLAVNMPLHAAYVTKEMSSMHPLGDHRILPLSEFDGMWEILDVWRD
jgi:hypothetical protein